jgi:chromosome segregation ATPase
METKQTYIVQNEIKVKNLLAEMYNSESALLSKISRKKDHLNSLKQEIRELEKDYKNQNKLRNELTQKFEDLQDSRSSDWDQFKREYELVLDFAEGDKFSFVETAETFMDELNDKIASLEEMIKKSSAEAKKKSQQMLDDLKERRKDLQDRLDEVKDDSGELWIEVRQWFIERANTVRSMF